MKTPTVSAPPRSTDPFAEIAACLRAWRASSTKGRRIPADLWNQAAALARRHGINPTATALNLNDYDLKRRVESPEARGAGSEPSPTFVQLPLNGAPAPAPRSETVEIARPDGSRLSLCLPATSAQELLPLVQAFLRS